ncbi:MAG: S-layer homology domain-containing protein [Lachnospiraceae bacterium]|nr:S-layer homology domain-containing protein [Lachnospiraceae bacterium]
MRKRLARLLTLAMTASLLASASVGAAESDEAYVYVEEISEDNSADEDFYEDYYEDDQDEYPEDEVSEEDSDEDAGEDEEDMSPSEEADAVNAEDETDSAAEEVEWGEYESDDAAEAVASGTCGTKVTWTLDAKGVLTIAGKGAMADYEEWGAPWYDKQTKIKSVIIKDGVTSVGRCAFLDCTNIEKAVIAGSVTTLEYGAFCGCLKLKKIEIPKDVTSIRNSVFSGCTSLSSVTIPDGVTEIMHGAFLGCSSLSSVKIPKSMKEIEYSVFRDCDNLKCVFYGADQKAWNSISIGIQNESLKSAGIHYNGEGHKKGSWMVIKPATSKATGVRAIRCTICRTVLEKKTIEKTKMPFKDVQENSSFGTAIAWAQQQGITGGINATTFGTNQSCTRGQIVTFLWRAAGSPEPKKSAGFKDVKKGSAFYKAVSWAVEKGITNGINSTTFGVDQSCTRGQAVTFIWRYAGKTKSTKTVSFRDVPKTMFCYEAVRWAVEKGVTSGTTSTTFAPNAACTRGQIVTFLYRYMV